jgi:hypothetical protein
MPKLAHNSVMLRPLKLASTTNRIRCSETSIALHPIPASNPQRLTSHPLQPLLENLQKQKV